MSLSDLALPPVRLRLRHALDNGTEKLALKAVLAAAHLIGLAIGASLRQLRGTGNPLATAEAVIRELELKAKIAWELTELIAARLDKIPDRQRPHYTPRQRFRILEIKNLLGWNRELIARAVRVSPNTISNWERRTDPEDRTVGSTVKPVPPVRRFADVVRSTVQAMARAGFGGEDRIAQVLVRAGWTVSARSVRRMGREPHRSNPTPPPPHDKKRSNPVVASFVHHVWMMDVTVVRAFLGNEF